MSQQKSILMPQSGKNGDGWMKVVCFHTPLQGCRLGLFGFSEEKFSPTTIVNKRNVRGRITRKESRFFI